jgi:hypothetical protein
MNLHVSTLASWAVATLLLQAASVAQIVGPTATRLTDDDLRQVRSLAANAGSTWLMLAERPEKSMPDQWPVNLYFEPRESATAVRRGRLGFLKAQLVAPGDYSGVRQWELLPFSLDWAQVPSEPGRPLRVDTDQDRPFAIVSFRADDGTHQELLDIVTLIRSSPLVPAAAAEKWTRGDERIKAQVNGAWAIDRLTLVQPGSAEVALIDAGAADRSGQYVKPRLAGRAWGVAELSWWGL